MSAARSVMILASGTGGHVFPALAVAEELRARGVGVVWVGSRRGIEARVLPAHGLHLECLELAPLRRRDALGLAQAAPRIAWAALRGARLLRRHRPDAALGMGGMRSCAVGLACRLVRTPLVLHEQNAVAGLANRMLAPLARCVLSGYAQVQGLSAPVRHVGTPVRAALEGPLPPPAPAGPLRLLVLGGSQGAEALNAALPQAAALLQGRLELRIRHQTGAGADCRYPEAVQARTCAFIDKMREAYAWADLVVARAGAGTLAELSCAGRGAVLVPYPHAADQHQRENARAQAAVGAAEVIAQAELTPRRLADALLELGGDRARLRAMARAARALVRPRAAAAVADCLLECAA